MADPYQLTCNQDDLPAVLIDLSPGAPGEDVHDSRDDVLLPPPRVECAANHLERPAPPRSASLPATVPTRRERRLQETLDNVGLLYALPRLQQALWRTWLAGDPQGVPYFRPRIAAVAATAPAPRRGGRSLRRPRIGRAPSAPARPRDHSSPPRGCLCYNCRGTSPLL